VTSRPNEQVAPMRVRTLTRATCSIALVAAVLSGCSEGGRYTVTASFDDVGDLVAGHSVQVADVRVGRIESIKLQPDFTAEVSMSIRDGVRIPQASIALLRTTSLLGEKFVELRPGDNVEPDQRPYLTDGSKVPFSDQAPEIEFVAEEAIRILGAVAADDLATIAETGAEGFAGRAEDLRRLVTDLATFSRTLAERSTDITKIIDGFDRALSSLAGGSDEIATLLTNLSDTTRILADNRDRAINALEQLTRLAGVQNEVLTKYHGNLDTQIKQVASIVDVAVTQIGEVSRLVDWLASFTEMIPQAIPNDFVQVFGWVAPTGTPQGAP
jgi:phospholipid/cholesterol/gamma-HCH transport system substrate-binding protein